MLDLINFSVIERLPRALPETEREEQTACGNQPVHLKKIRRDQRDDQPDKRLYQISVYRRHAGIEDFPRAGFCEFLFGRAHARGDEPDSEAMVGDHFQHFHAAVTRRFAVSAENFQIKQVISRGVVGNCGHDQQNYAAEHRNGYK